MLRRTLVKASVALGASSQLIGLTSAKEEGVIEEATHRDEDKSDRKEPYTTEPGTAGNTNITGYYKVTLIPDSTLPEEGGKKIGGTDKSVEQLIEGESTGIGATSEAAFPDNVRNENHIIYNGRTYRPHVIESGDLPREMAENMVENDNAST